MKNKKIIKAWYAKIGRKGGLSKSIAKISAAKINGRLRGSTKKKKVDISQAALVQSSKIQKEEQGAKGQSQKAVGTGSQNLKEVSEEAGTKREGIQGIG